MSESEDWIGGTYYIMRWGSDRTGRECREITVVGREVIKIAISRRGVICAINKYGTTPAECAAVPRATGRKRPTDCRTQRFGSGAMTGPYAPGVVGGGDGGTLTRPDEYIVPVGRGAYDVRYVRPDRRGGSNSGK